MGLEPTTTGITIPRQNGAGIRLAADSLQYTVPPKAAWLLASPLVLQMHLTDWQLRALNAFGLAPVYVSTDTTDERLVLTAPKGFLLTREIAGKLAGLRVQTRPLNGRYEISITLSG